MGSLLLTWLPMAREEHEPQRPPQAAPWIQDPDGSWQRWWCLLANGGPR